MDTKALGWAAAIALLIPLLLACRGGSSSGSWDDDDYDLHTVSYDITDHGVICHKESTESYSSGDDYERRRCTWYCGRYKGEKEVYVSLTFERDKPDGEWHLEREYIRDGDCW